MPCPPSLNSPSPNLPSPTCDICPCKSAVAGSAASAGPSGPGASGNPPAPNAARGPGRGKSTTKNTIRFANGEIHLAENDLQAAGFGMAWRHVRTWGNQMSDNYDGPNGNNWFCSDLPYLGGSASTTLVVVGDANNVLW